MPRSRNLFPLADTAITRAFLTLSAKGGEMLRRGGTRVRHAGARGLAGRGVATVTRAFVRLEDVVLRYPDSLKLYTLLRSLSDQQRANGGAPVTDVARLADAAGVEMAHLPRLVATGIDAGWIMETADGALSLTASAVVALTELSGDALDRLTTLAGRWTASLSASPPRPPSSPAPDQSA